MPREVTLKAGVGGGETRTLKVRIDDQDATPWGLGAELAVVGTDTPRLDAPAKTTGAARYTMDIVRPGMAYCRLVRCFHAHANVKAVDISAAQRLPGVLGVEVLLKPGDTATFSGQGVAAVCAETPETLDDAVAAVRVEYDVLPCAVTTDDAMANDAPRVEARRANYDDERARDQGDPDAALAAAKFKVSAEFRTQVQNHIALEPHGSLVEFADDGTVTVWASTQGTGAFQKSVADTLGLPESKVRVITEHLGGGFGAKLGGIDAWDQAALRFAKQLKRPVKAMLDRREEHLIAGCRPDSIQRLTAGCDADGKLTVITGEIYGTPGNGRRGAGANNHNLYGQAHARMAQTSVATHTGRSRAFRAPGHPQGIFALDGLIDMLAEAAGEDPLAFRLKNDGHPVRQAQWREGGKLIEWERWRKTRPGGDAGPVKRGVGCAAAIWYQAGRGSWRVDVEVSTSGDVVVSNAVQDIGTGTRTLLAVMVAEELGIAPWDVTVRVGDTIHPAGPPSGGSQTAPSIAPAAREAGLRAREGLVAALAADWGCKPEEVTHGGGKFAGPGGKSASFREACAQLGPGGLSVSGQRRPNFDGFHPQTAGCQFAQVAVDTETGVVRVEHVVAVHDAGRIVNTLAARSQVIGGVIQGVSYALYEDRRLDRNLGDMVNPTLDTYRITGIADTPRIDCVFTELESGFNNAGMMGLGEPVTVPTAGAVANAVYHAIGARVFELPITPARVLAALEKVR